MEEKKYIPKLPSALLSFLIIWGIILLGSSLFHLWQSKTIIPLFQSWILISTRGYLGNPFALDGLKASPEYIYELKGDSAYREGNIDGAIRAFSSALDFGSNSIIELKIALLSIEKMNGSGTQETLSGTLQTGLEESRARIDKDSENRGKYFGNGNTLSNQSPLFEVRDKETIDW